MTTQDIKARKRTEPRPSGSGRTPANIPLFSGAPRQILRTASTVLFASAAVLAQSDDPPALPDGTGEELGKRLIRRASKGADEDLMDTAMRLMSEAARRLEIDFDPGERTQAVQRSIVDRLDDAIRIAAAQRRLSRRQRRPTAADKRRMSRGKPRTPDERSGTSEEMIGQERSKKRNGDLITEERKPVGGEIHELRRSWGHLPMREREEIIQGIDDGFIERYRRWIELYYRALQETED